MSAPVSVIVPSFGPPGSHYAAFVPRFWQAIKAMSPRPAEVVVVHTDPEPLGILTSCWGHTDVRAVVPDGTSMAEMINAGVRAASQEWCCTVGVDDMLTPDALRHLPDAMRVGAEIMAWDHQEENGAVYVSTWEPYRLLRYNTLTGSSPFTRGIWSHCGGFPDVAWCDWGFWLRCASVGARVFCTNHVGVTWDSGRGRETISQQARSPTVSASRNAEIHNLIVGLMT